MVAKSGFGGNSSNFMNGRNGVDQLSILVVIVAAILLVINLFARTLPLTIIVLLLVAYAVFRILSPDVASRRRENDQVMSKLGPVSGWISNPAAAAREGREFKHATCPNCHQHVRVPRGKGHIRVTCPRCHQKFDLRS
jgi:ribosomal protein L37AE/L43A